MIVIAVDADDLRAVDLRAQDLARFKIGGNEDAGFQCRAAAWAATAVGQVARRRATDDFEAEIARLCKRHCHHAIFEAERRKADGVVLQVDRPAANSLTQLGGF